MHTFAPPTGMPQPRGRLQARNTPCRSSCPRVVPKPRGPPLPSPWSLRPPKPPCQSPFLPVASATHASRHECLLQAPHRRPPVPRTECRAVALLPCRNLRSRGSGSRGEGVARNSTGEWEVVDPIVAAGRALVLAGAPDEDGSSAATASTGPRYGASPPLPRPATGPSVRPPTLRFSVLKAGAQSTDTPSAPPSVPLCLCAERFPASPPAPGPRQPGPPAPGSAATSSI